MRSFPRDLLAVLRAPGDGATLQYTAFDGVQEALCEGVLLAPVRVFPVHAGIPRFALSPATKTAFVTRWRDRLVASARTDARIAAFLAETPAVTRTQALYNFQWRRLTLMGEARSGAQVRRYLGAPFDPRPALGLEIGCGNGRHSRHIADYVERLLSIDFGDHVEVAAAQHAGDPRIAFVQASAAALPLAPSSVDLVFTSGVLHHVPGSTRAAFAEAARTVAPHGCLACWVYGVWRRRRLQAAVDAVRALTRRLPWRLVLFASYLGAPFLRPAARACGYSFQDEHPTYRDCVYYLFDWLTPELQRKHTPEELMRWCAEEGLRVLTTFTPPAGVLARRET